MTRPPLAKVEGATAYDVPLVIRMSPGIRRRVAAHLRVPRLTRAALQSAVEDVVTEWLCKVTGRRDDD